jgi:putative transposase
MKRRSYSAREITSKLQQADDLAAKGSVQKEIAKALGVSVMTYHRWRKAQQKQKQITSKVLNGGPAQRAAAGQISRIQALELENTRLRQLITDFLLGNLKLPETCGKVVADR